MVGAGSMGAGVAALLARAGLEVQLGSRAAAQAASVAERAGSTTYPASPPVASAPVLSEIEFAGVDLVVFAVPVDALPAAVASVGARIGERSAVLVVSKGLVAAARSTCRRYVARACDRPRASPALGGPVHAAEAVERGASVGARLARRRLPPAARRGARRAGPRGRARRGGHGRQLAGVRQERRRSRRVRRRRPSGTNAAGAAAGACLLRDRTTLAARHGAHIPSTFTGPRRAPVISSPPCSRPAAATDGRGSCSADGMSARAASPEAPVAHGRSRGVPRAASSSGAAPDLVDGRCSARRARVRSRDDGRAPRCLEGRVVARGQGRGPASPAATARAA